MNTPSYAYSTVGSSFAESALRSATRRSNRGRQVDANKELIVLLPGDDPREKLDLRSDAEWELFQTVMLEDYNGVISDSDMHPGMGQNSSVHSGGHRPFTSRVTSKTDLSTICSASHNSQSLAGTSGDQPGAFTKESVMVPGVRPAAIDLASLTAQLRHQESLADRRQPVSSSSRGQGSSKSIAQKTIVNSTEYEDVAYYEVELDVEDEAVADSLYARYILPKLSHIPSTSVNNVKRGNATNLNLLPACPSSSSSSTANMHPSPVQSQGTNAVVMPVRLGPGRPTKASSASTANPTSASSSSTNNPSFSKNIGQEEERYGREAGSSRLAFRRVFSRLISRLERELMLRETMLQQEFRLSSGDSFHENEGGNNSNTNIHSANGTTSSSAAACSVADVAVTQRHLQLMRRQTHAQIGACQSLYRSYRNRHDKSEGNRAENKVGDSAVDNTFTGNLDRALHCLLHQQHLTLQSVQLSSPINDNAAGGSKSDRPSPQLYTLATNRPTLPVFRREPSSAISQFGPRQPFGSSSGVIAPSLSDEGEDDTISERFRALRSLSVQQILSFLGEDYALQLLCELRPRLFPACSDLPEQEEKSLNRAILMHWAQLRSQTKQSLLRAFHVFMMPLWSLPPRALLPQSTDFSLVTLEQSYQRLQQIQQDLDRARLIVDRVRRREKLKKELLKQTGEQWQSMILQDSIPDLQQKIQQQLMSRPLGVTDHKRETNDESVTYMQKTTQPPQGEESMYGERRRRGRPRRAESFSQPSPSVAHTTNISNHSSHIKNKNVPTLPLASPALQRDRYGKFLRRSSRTGGTPSLEQKIIESEDDDEDGMLTDMDDPDFSAAKRLPARNDDEWKVPPAAKRLFTMGQWLPFTMQDISDEQTTDAEAKEERISNKSKNTNQQGLSKSSRYH